MVKNKVSCLEEEEEKAMMLEMKMWGTLPHEAVSEACVIPGTLGNHD